MKLEKSHIQSWEDLANSFLKQYHYNLYMALNRRHVQCLSQNSNESFKRYVQRWRELEAQVQPSLLDKELVDMFMYILQSLYFEIMTGITSSDFYDLMKVGECINSGFQNRKIQDASSRQTSKNESLNNSQ